MEEPSIPWGLVGVTVCRGNEQVTQHCKVLDTDDFHIVDGMHFWRRIPEVQLLSL